MMIGITIFGCVALVILMYVLFYEDESYDVPFSIYACPDLSCVGGRIAREEEHPTPVCAACGEVMIKR